jgi:hypothetical protein
MTGLNIQPYIIERLMFTGLVIVGVAFVIFGIVAAYFVVRGTGGTDR